MRRITMAEVLLDGYDFCGRLRNAIAAEKSLAAFARKHGLKEQSVRDAEAMRSVSKDACKALGLVKVLRYPPLDGKGSLVSLKIIQEKLNNFVSQCGTQRAAAQRLGIHESHLSNIQNAFRGVTPVLYKLGYGLPVVRYIALDAV
ncbi:MULTISPECIES: hypothetical protein [Acetobacter]|nr:MULTISPECIES: hypothetical protein [Acetobacter]